VYSVDPFLVGRKVELVFNPFDMTRLEVWWAGRKAGTAVPQVIGRHAHPKAPPDEDPEPVTYTGIDYLGLISAAGRDAASGGPAGQDGPPGQDDAGDAGSQDQR
jgi:putative transposase